MCLDVSFSQFSYEEYGKKKQGMQETPKRQQKKTERVLKKGKVGLVGELEKIIFVVALGKTSPLVVFVIVS